MQARIQKWGNSLALRIPKALAKDAGLSEDVAVELSIAKGKVIVSPLPAEPPSLAELLSEITPENLHGEWDSGPAVGREEW